jgi:hypothetical protein
MSATPAFAEQTCRPSLTLTRAQYSPMRLPNRERTWTAVLSADASSCETSSGHFEIAYSMEKENVLDYEVREEFTWVSGSQKISKEFWIDEAVTAYRLGSIAPCPCRK